MPRKLEAATFGYEPIPPDERETAIQVYRDSERRMRAVGRFEAAVRYQNTADAIERGYIQGDEWSMLALYLAGHGIGVE